MIQLIEKISSRFGRKEPSIFPSGLSEMLREKKAQAARGGNRLTVVVVSFPGENRFLGEYFFRRAIIVISKICAKRKVAFYPAEQKFLLIFEASVEDAETVLSEAVPELMREDIRFQVLV